MPAKRIFSHGQSVEFVEDRRVQLDAYLQKILADPILAGAPRVRLREAAVHILT